MLPREESCGLGLPSTCPSDSSGGSHVGFMMCLSVLAEFRGVFRSACLCTAGVFQECLIVYLPFCSWEIYSLDLLPSRRLNHTSSWLMVVMMALWVEEEDREEEQGDDRAG